MEERRSIKVNGYGDKYGDLYDITRSGRIIIKRNNRVRHRNGDEYGYANVHLTKNGERMLFKTFEIWKATFHDADLNEYKGQK
ncbi:3-ketosteroid-delta-1-dehydrogenase [Pseudoneobacillus sp. C159]